MDALRVVTKEVHDAPALLDACHWVGLEAVVPVHELGAVPHREDWNVVSCRDMGQLLWYAAI